MTQYDDDAERLAEDAVCNRCGKSGLEWVDCGTAGYRLYDGMRLHKCISRTASADEFKDVG